MANDNTIPPEFDPRYQDKQKAYYDMRQKDYEYEEWKRRRDIEMGRYNAYPGGDIRERDLERKISQLENLVMKMITEIQLLRQSVYDALKPLTNMDELKK